MNENKIILCSSSPRRQLLLKELEIHFETMKKDVDEDFPDHLKGAEVAVYLAEKKMHAIRNEFQPEMVYMTADTIVWLDDEVLGKPVDKKDAVRMLKKLSGKKHRVYTAVCLSNLKKTEVLCIESAVQFNELTIDAITGYVEDFAPFDKAGSYGAQECLPAGLNPCSKEEMGFLESIHKADLFERTLTKNQQHVAMIHSIDGSYFNVMGLPVVELYEAMNRWHLLP